MSKHLFVSLEIYWHVLACCLIQQRLGPVQEWRWMPFVQADVGCVRVWWASREVTSEGGGWNHLGESYDQWK